MPNSQHVIRCRKCGRLFSSTAYQQHVVSCKGPPVCNIILPEIGTIELSDSPLFIRALIIPYESFEIVDMRLLIPKNIEIERVIPDEPPSGLIAAQRLKMLYMLRVKSPGDYVIGPLELDARFDDDKIQTIRSNKLRVTARSKTPEVTLHVVSPEITPTLVRTPFRLEFHNRLNKPVRSIEPRIRASACYCERIEPILNVDSNSTVSVETFLTPKDPGKHSITIEYLVRHSDERAITHSISVPLTVRTMPPDIKVMMNADEIERENCRFHVKIWAHNAGKGPATNLKITIEIPETETNLLAGMLWSFDSIVAPGQDSQMIDLWLEPTEPFSAKRIRISRIEACFNDAEMKPLMPVVIEEKEFSPV